MNKRSSAVNLIYPFQTQEVRDLSWACFSQPLLFTAQLDTPGLSSPVTDCAPELTPQRRLWLEQLDRDASPLIDHLAQRNSHRLGVYFEQLWLFFLRHDPATELVAHNLPVHDGGRTLGEFDCLYFCQQRQCHVHLELAVKFFIGRRPVDEVPASAADQWLGPDAQDRLDLKLNHLLQRQIQLADQAIAREQLFALGIENPLKEIALRGYLFQPHGESLPAPPGYNSQRQLQTWLTCSELERQAAENPDARFFMLPKMRWLGPAQATAADKQWSATELSRHMSAYFDSENYPLMVAALDAGGRETHRFFVADDDWPNSQRSTT